MVQAKNHCRWFVTLLLFFLGSFPGMSANYLCFTAEAPLSEVWYENYGGNAPDVQYSMDGGNTWRQLAAEVRLKLDSVGDKVYFRGNNPEGFSHELLDKYFQDGFDQRKGTRFGMNGRIAASGSVMSLIDGEGTTTTIPCSYCFASLFLYCMGITSTPELPATTLTDHCYEEMFLSCSSLSQASDLPATELADYCYSNMFRYCGELTRTPALPATKLAKGCYMEMFEECGNLTQVSDLPATTLAEECYASMFASCRSLTKAPALPATELTNRCYLQMFSHTGLTQAPALPATKLAEGCYSLMFSMTGITECPALPAMELEEQCYRYMFLSCDKLTTVPDLPATELVRECYLGMFSGCKSLNYIKVGVSSLENDVDATKNWVGGILKGGVFVFPCGSRYDKRGDNDVPANFSIVSSPVVIFQNRDSTVLYVDTVECGTVPVYRGMDPPSAGEGTVFLNWDKELDVIGLADKYYYTAVYENMGDEPSPNCFYFMSESDVCSFSIENFGGNNPNLEYSLNGGVTWFPLSEGVTVTLQGLESRAYVRGTNPNGFSRQEDVYTRFVTSGEITTRGSVMSLIDGDGSSTVIPNDYCFTRLFENTTISSAPELTADSLKASCYDHMFAGCERLFFTPKLPALKLRPYCYSHMFENCAILYKVVELPATEMAPYCCVDMFRNCKSLSELPGMMPAMAMAEGSCERMFYGCESITVMLKLSAETLAKDCYAYMFYGCTSLRITSGLSAPRLAERCYVSMFENCTSLYEDVKILADELAENCCESMFKGCTGIQSAYPPGMELKKECFKEMFWGCEQLEYISVGVYTLDNDFDATLNWVEGVDKDGLFVFPCGSTYDKHGVSEVPDNFVVKLPPIIVFLNADSTEIWRDTVDCESVPVYGGPTPTYGEGLTFIGWDRLLSIPSENGAVDYYVAQYANASDVPPGPWLCFTAEEAGSEIWYTNYGENHPDMQYSVDDGETWRSLGDKDTVRLENEGDKVYLRGTNPDGFSHSASDKTCFGMSGKIAASGDVLCLIGGDDAPKEIPCAYCFESLFAGCESLTTAPEISAIALELACYKNMFSHCSNLKNMPQLPSLSLKPECYASMFSHCSSLTETFDLPASMVRELCYANMFEECTSLVRAPELMTSLRSEGCFYAMFKGCTSLKRAPILSGYTFVRECYAHMFEGCSSLEYIEVEFLTLDNDVHATEDWVKGVDNYGLFVFPCGSKYDKHGDSEVPNYFKIKSSPIIVFLNADSTELWRDTISCYTFPMYKGEEPTMGDGTVFRGWDKPFEVHHEPGVYYYVAQYQRFDDNAEYDWLCFTAEEPSTVWFSQETTEPAFIQYSRDGGKTWTTWNATEKLQLENAGDKIHVRGYNPDGASLVYVSFGMLGRVAASGTVMSLIDGTGETTVIPCDGCFSSLFGGCRALVQAPKLTATVLTKACYERMFSFCENLKKAPELPALEVKESSYERMFANCYSLQTAPELPATTLGDFCYADMFNSCTTLVAASVLPATQLTRACYSSMYTHCTNLRVVPLDMLPATELSFACYAGMFFLCESIINTPNLPATKLDSFCYVGMFAECVSLTQTSSLPATELVDSCYSGMFRSCLSLVEAPDLPAMQLKKNCYAYMFHNCQSLLHAPELPATVLDSSCYAYMFSNCPKLDYIKVGVMSLDNSFDATRGWVLGVSGEGTFIFPCGSKYDERGASEVPWEFTIISSPIVIFQNPDSTELQRDTIDCETMPVYRGDEPTYGEDLVFVGWDPEPAVHPTPDIYYYTAVYKKAGAPDMDKCLYFTAEAAGSSVWYENSGGNSPDVQYSIDGGKTWRPLEAGVKVTLENVGDTAYFKGNNPKGFSHISGDDGSLQYTSFGMSGAIAAGGSVMSLIDGEGNATEIPNAGCFSNLFSGCSSLTKAPELPATKLTPACYEGMFHQCASLEVAPELPATKLVANCYSNMFAQCGSLVTPPDLPAETLADGCYEGMFKGCVSLEQAPELPATRLVNSSYKDMFNGCSSLNYIKVGLMTLDNDVEATLDWVSGVDGPGTFIFPCGSKYDKHGVSEVPNDFKIVSSPIVVFQNPGGAELWRDTIDCKTVPEYKGEEPFIGENYTFVGWDNELTVLPIPDTYYFTALYEEKEPLAVVDSAITACDSFVFNGITYHESASWNDTLATTEGADHVIAYHLTIHKGVTTDTTIMAEGSFSWRGVTYTENASWNDTLQTAFGCDSVVTYHLEMQSVGTDPIVVEKNLSACDSFLFKGITYRESASWNDTLQSVSGVDSIITYHLTLHQGVVVDTTVMGMGRVTWRGVTYTESVSWNDTLQTATGCDSIVRINLVVKTPSIPPIVVDKIVSACDSFVYNGITYHENSEWNEMLKSVSGVDSFVSYRLFIRKGATLDTTITAEGSYTWKGTIYTEDASWNDTLQTIHGCDSIVRYHLTVNEEKPTLQLTVEEELYLVLPGGSETIFYELTGGEGSKYEVRYEDRTICSGDVTNDSTVSLTCPKDLEPGAYTATLEMCDAEGNCAEKDFTFNVMLPDNKRKSYYVKVWNDVVICRNGEGEFQSFQWYKGRKKCENAAQQYLNDVSLLDGEYMVYVTDKDGRSYFIEPVVYAPVEAAYAITAEPNVVARNADFTVKVSGVAEEDLLNARIVVYRANGVIESVIDEVEMERVMRLKSGEYVIVLTVNDGKNANCKVLVK